MYAPEFETCAAITPLAVLYTRSRFSVAVSTVCVLPLSISQRISFFESALLM